MNKDNKKGLADATPRHYKHDQEQQLKAFAEQLKKERSEVEEKLVGNAGTDKMDLAVLVRIYTELINAFPDHTGEARFHSFLRVAQRMYAKYIQYDVSIEEVKSLLRASELEKQRMSPLMNHNKKKTQFRKLVQELARKKWADKGCKSIRLSEMCDVVWSMLVDRERSESTPQDERQLIKERMPDKAEGLKASIRGVSPKEAKKAGAPKNR